MSNEPHLQPLTEDSENLFSKAINDAFAVGNDRVAVIVTMAIVEDWIRRALADYFVHDVEIQKRFFDPTQGKIAGLASMVDMAFLVGLLSRDVCAHIKLMAHLRNIFAHDWKMSSFEDMEKSEDKNIKKKVAELKTYYGSLPEGHGYPLIVAYLLLTMVVMLGIVPMVSRARAEARIINKNSYSYWGTNEQFEEKLNEMFNTAERRRKGQT